MSLKSEQKRIRGRGGEGFKKILGLSKLIFLVILQFILLIITAV